VAKVRLLVVVLVALGAGAAVAVLPGSVQPASGSPTLPPAATPIQHLVVIFDANVSFDHYFATYPNAANLPGERPFTAAAGTPVPNNLQSPTNLLSPHNPNSGQPARFTPADTITCGNNQGYTTEQQAFNGGLMNKFPEFTGGSCGAKVMNYYDGNTVTGLWNLAQHFTMSDSYFGTTFGPATPGALNLISGNTHGATGPTGAANGTIISNADPNGDDCGSAASGGGNGVTGQNIGDLMNTAGVSWGWFQGGFAPTSTSGGRATCGRSHKNSGGATVIDYSAHSEPFQYYASTANPHHLPPSSTAMIGLTDQANHQYDLLDFDHAVANNNLPQVSFLRPAAFENAHPGNSGPVDEQHWIARVVDEVEQSPAWSNTAIVITYDNSDGWYDHVIAPSGIQEHSNAAEDAAVCNSAPPSGGYLDRCGPGPRLPVIVVSPWVAPNTIHHTQLEQTSIMKFIEDNWLGGQRIGGNSFDQRPVSLGISPPSVFDFNVADARAPKVYLDPASGAVTATPPPGVAASPDAPPPTTTTTTTPTTTTSTTTTTSRTPPPTFKPKLASLSTKRHGKKLSVTLKITGVTSSRGKITVKLSLIKAKNTVARGSGTVKRGKLSLTLKSKKTFTKGTYLLKLSVTQAHRTAKLSKKLKLK
jgi:phospholipase C